MFHATNNNSSVISFPIKKIHELSSSIYIAVESESCYEMIDEQNIKTLFISLPLCSSSASREHERERSLVHSTLILLSSTRLYWVSTRCLYISIQSQSQWFIVKKIELSHWSRAVAVANCWTHTIVAYLIKSSKFCSFSVMTFDGLAAISHNSFGRHASRILFANVILSFKSICSNFALVFDFFEMKSSISLVDGESAKKNSKQWLNETEHTEINLSIARNSGSCCANCTISHPLHMKLPTRMQFYWCWYLLNVSFSRLSHFWFVY